MIIYRIFIFINNKYEDIFGRCFEIICKCINFCECEECKRCKCKICDCFYFNKNKENIINNNKLKENININSSIQEIISLKNIIIENYQNQNIIKRDMKDIKKELSYKNNQSNEEIKNDFNIKNEVDNI